MKIIKDQLGIDELNRMAAATFGDMVKAVVDVDREWVAVDAELHSDLEALLLQNGCQQSSLWGINLYPAEPLENFVEFDSMINIRPSAGNRTRGVADAGLRSKICAVVQKRIKR